MKAYKIIPLVTIILMAVMNNQAHAYNAGYKEEDNNLAIWYPTDAKEAEISYWAWKGKVGKNAAISPDIFPLLIFSHGFGGIKYNQIYLAEFLARQGYIIVALDHDDDQAHGLQLLVNRPRSISKALDLILNNLELKNHIAKDKIGMLGHSMGGYTALSIAGGMPNFAKHPSLAKIPAALRQLYLNLKDVDDSFEDARIKAAVLLAPGPMQLFDQASLSAIKIPLLIIEAEQDEVIDPKLLLALKKNLPQSPEYFLLKGAGHYAFLPLSDSDYIRRIAPEICYDPDLPRADLHQIIQREVLLFFDKRFK